MKLTVGELRTMLKNLPDDLPVHVNDVLVGKYSEEDIDAFHSESDENGPAAFVIMVGV